MIHLSADRRKLQAGPRRPLRCLSLGLRPQPGGFEGVLPVSEGLLSHCSPVPDHEEDGEAVTVLHGDLAGRSHSDDLDDRDHLVSGVDQLYRVKPVPGQRRPVLLVDQTYGLLSAVGPKEKRLEIHVWVIELGQGIKVTRL
jgi:hypothetical protein